MKSLLFYDIVRRSRIKFHSQYWGFQIFMSISVNDEIRIFVVIRDVKNAQDGQIFAKSCASSLFRHFKIIQIPKKQNASSGIRTREGPTEGLDDLHYAIKSLNTTESNWIIMFFRMTENVINFTIYGKLVLSRKPKIHQEFFLFDFDKKYIEPTPPET